MDKMPPTIQDHSDEEEARIQAAIASDPDTWEAPGKTRVPPPRATRRVQQKPGNHQAGQCCAEGPQDA